MGAFVLDWLVVLFSAIATVLEGAGDATADKENITWLSTGVGLELDVGSALELFCVVGAGGGVIKEVDRTVRGS